MNPVNIIGLGMGPQDLTEGHLKMIERADVLVGGKRLLDFFKDSKAQKKSIGKDIEAVVKFVQKKMKAHHVVVLASGDPLFYGIGATLTKALGTEKVIIHPNISTVSRLRSTAAGMRMIQSEKRVMNMGMIVSPAPLITPP